MIIGNYGRDNKTKRLKLSVLNWLSEQRHAILRIDKLGGLQLTCRLDMEDPSTQKATLLISPRMHWYTIIYCIASATVDKQKQTSDLSTTAHVFLLQLLRATMHSGHHWLQPDSAKQLWAQQQVTVFQAQPAKESSYTRQECCAETVPTLASDSIIACSAFEILRKLITPVGRK